MQREPTVFQDTTFDVVVVGGGITGACIAHDATLRGLSVALVERHDFGSATSAASSKLLHGGIRYLQQARFDKVRESARERACFQRIAPHLTRWIPFLVPTQRGLLRGRRFLGCGMWLYERLTRGEDRNVLDPAKQVPRRTFYPRAELARLVPALAARDDVTGAHLLYESHLHSSERMTLAFLKSAFRGGAVVGNYLTVDGVLMRDGRVEGVTVIDTLTDDHFDIRARVVVNAAGPWLAGLNERLGVGRLRVPIRGFSTGAHIVTRQVTDTFALALPTRRRSSSIIDRGGRYIFVIPWRGHSLIGTSDRPFSGKLDDVGPTEADVVDLLSDVNDALPGLGLTRGDVSHAFAGLYPLTARDVRPDVYQGTGDYQVIDHGRVGGHDGVVSVLGAKYTTARQLAERATTLIGHRLGRSPIPSLTGQTPLVGGEIDNLERFTDDAINRHTARLARDAVEHLVHHYGTEIDAVVAGATGDDRLLTPLSPDRESVGAEIRFAVDEEMAVTLSDVVFRRTGLGTLGDPGVECLRRCAEIMGACLGWSEARMRDEVQQTRTLFTACES
jgi:glycerol-3-phosphate dehydrogenase